MTTSDYTSEIPYGYCHCGCGQKTNLAKSNHAKYGWIKGQPLKYILGHRFKIHNPIDHFWSRVNKDGSIPEHMPHLGKCWEWTSYLVGGYGRCTYPNEILAHRISWIIVYGKIPDGLFVLHKCDNPKCVNPEHLFLGTHQDNIKDMIAKGRQNYVHDQFGENNGTCKLSDKQVAEIISHHKQGGIYQKDLAKEYGVSGGLISMLIKGGGRPYKK